MDLKYKLFKTNKGHIFHINKEFYELSELNPLSDYYRNDVRFIFYEEDFIVIGVSNYKKMKRFIIKREIRSCKYCGSNFVIIISQRNFTKVYCSDDCYKKGFSLYNPSKRPEVRAKHRANFDASPKAIAIRREQNLKSDYQRNLSKIMTERNLKDNPMNHPEHRQAWINGMIKSALHYPTYYHGKVVFSSEEKKLLDFLLFNLSQEHFLFNSFYTFDVLLFSKFIWEHHSPRTWEGEIIEFYYEARRKKLDDLGFSDYILIITQEVKQFESALTYILENNKRDKIFYTSKHLDTEVVIPGIGAITIREFMESQS